MSENRPFQVDIDESQEFIYKIKVAGELRRGTQLSGVTWKQYVSHARSLARTKRIIFDLTKMSFWDTGGMLEVVSAVVEINRQYVKRSGIIAPEDSHLLVLANLLEFAKRKFNDQTITESDLPVRETQSELVEFLES